MFECDYQQCGLTILDAKGYSMMNNIKSGQLLLVHSNASTSDVTTEISYYEQCGCCTNDSGIKVIIYQHSYEIIIIFLHLKLKLMSIFCSTCYGKNFVTVNHLELTAVLFSQHCIDITMKSCNTTSLSPSYYYPSGSMIKIFDCGFSKIVGSDVIIYVQTYLLIEYSNVFYKQ